MEPLNLCSDRCSRYPLDRNRRITDLSLIVFALFIGFYLAFIITSTDSSSKSESNSKVIYDEFRYNKYDAHPWRVPEPWRRFVKQDSQYLASGERPAVKVGPPETDLSKFLTDHHILRNIIHHLDYRPKYFPIEIGFFCLIFFLILIILNKSPKLYVWFGIITLSFTVIVLCFFVYYGVPAQILEHAVGHYPSAKLDTIIRSLCPLFIIYISTVLINIYHVKINAITIFVRHSIRPLFKIPSIVIFGFFIVLIKYTIINSAVYNFGLTKVTHTWSSYGWIVALRFISYFSTMVIGQTVGTWHWTETKRDAPKCIILESIKIVTRYHLASIICAAVGVIPQIIAIIVAFVGPKTNTSYKLNERHYFTRIICSLYLIYYIESFSLVLVATQGLSFFRAAEKSFHLMSKNSSFFLAALKIHFLIFKILLDTMEKASMFFGPLEATVYEAIIGITFAASIATMFRMLEHEEHVEEELKLEKFEDIFSQNK